MRDFDDKVAAITGAGSGIGRALALELGRRGAELALSDVDTAGLDETVARCRAISSRAVSAHRVDVAVRDAVYEWAETVADEHGRVNLVANNAGVAVAATVEAVTYEDFEWLMGVNFWGVVHGTKAFLPYLRATGEGHIVNISSVFGLLPVPAQSVYNSAKYAVRGFTDALRMELAIERCGVSCTTVHPGGVKTNIVHNARIDSSVAVVGGDPVRTRREFHRIAMTTPERAARQIVRAVERDAPRVLVGPDAHVLDLVSRLPIRAWQWPVVVGGRLARKRIGGAAAN
ncbi:MAG: SDR family NAD(P)-dependent oxidoreductase [Acidimicrobiales bacterium]